MLRQLLANAAAWGEDTASESSVSFQDTVPGGAVTMPVLQADATLLPFAARSFGSVLAFHVLHLIPDWRIALDEAVRVLRPGGAIVASFPTYSRAVAQGRAGAGGDGKGAVKKDREADRQPDPAAIGLTRDRGAPWADAVRAAARRHGIVRIPVGARDPVTVAAYLGGRATARQLDPVPVRSGTTLGEAVDHIERQLFSWTWPYTAEQAAVAAEVRDWAAAANMPLDTRHESESAVRWWVFELSS